MIEQQKINEDVKQPKNRLKSNKQYEKFKI